MQPQIDHLSEVTFAPRLKKGDELRVIAPAGSLKVLSEEHLNRATSHIESLGFLVTFGRHVFNSNYLGYASVADRLSDLHEAFENPSVHGILTAIGGFSSNQLLGHIRYDLIRKYPKMFCGHSDITALQNAILTRAGLITYSGPHFSTFAYEAPGDYTSNYFIKCVTKSSPFEIGHSDSWMDTTHHGAHLHRLQNLGPQIIREGTAEGRIVGGNLCTLNLLHGTPFMPRLNGCIVFMEEDDITGAATDVNFERDLQSLLHLTDARGIKALILGRFQGAAGMTVEKLKAIIHTKPECDHIPVVCGFDFGHTFPLCTFPIGGHARLTAKGGTHLEISTY